MQNKIVKVVLCSVVFFFIVRCGFLCISSVMGAVSSCFLYPVLRFQQLVVEPVQHWLHRRIDFAQLQKKYDGLQIEHDRLLHENIALHGMHSYDKAVSELLVFKRRYALSKGCIAQVLARHLSENSQFFLVNAGERQGIKKDMIALYGNSLIGKVDHVYQWYCKVCLITDASCKVGAVCAASSAKGIHEGINSQTKTVMHHVSHLEKVVPNDMILSTGEGLIFPQGFGLGTIQAVERGDLVYTIDIQPLVDFNLVQYCILIEKSNIEI